MKIIFLDVDGVLNSDEFFDSVKGKDSLLIENNIDIKAINLLKKIIKETGAKVVLATSFRYKKQGKALIELLANNQIRVDSLTPYIENERGIEIKEWLKENKDVESFVILDDEIFESYDEYLESRLIKMSGDGKSFGKGLQEKDAKKAIEMLGRIKTEEITR